MFLVSPFCWGSNLFFRRKITRKNNRKLFHFLRFVSNDFAPFKQRREINERKFLFHFNMTTIDKRYYFLLPFVPSTITTTNLFPLPLCDFEDSYNEEKSINRIVIKFDGIPSILKRKKTSKKRGMLWHSIASIDEVDAS
jgi:hypothetical protein